MNASFHTRVESNALEAAGNGASQAIKICSNIAGNLIAFLAFIQFLDTMCIWLGTNVDLPFISFKWILSKLFIPIALMMGVEWEDSLEVAKMIGLKTMVNEFVAYTELAEQIKLNSISVSYHYITVIHAFVWVNFPDRDGLLAWTGSISSDCNVCTMWLLQLFIDRYHVRCDGITRP